MKQRIEQLISYTQSSLYFCNEAFNEIWHVTQTPITKAEYDIVEGRPFGFYGIALQYCFIMEYTKLLDTHSSRSSENVASLNKLNKEVLNFLGTSFKLKYDDNKRLLKRVVGSDLYARLKKLRNKKFGHTDSDEINNPWKIEGFTGEQIKEIKEQIGIMLTVLNNVLNSFSDTGFILHNDNRTANFIRFHAKYKQYYFKNYIKALNEGYGLL